jgi:hypothetical protein
MTIPRQTTFKFSPTVNSKLMIATTAGIKKEPPRAPAAPLGERKEASTSSSQTAPPPKMLAQRKITDIMPTTSKSAKSDEYNYEFDDELVNQDSKAFDAYRLIDITPTGTKQKHHQGHGRPRKTILDTYLQTCYQPSDPGKHLYRCVGNGCDMTFSNRNLQRTLKHARVCTRIAKELRLRAKELTAKNALSKKVLGNESEDEMEVEVPVAASEMVIADEDREAKVVVKKQKMEDGTAVPTAEWFEEAKRLGKAERHRRLDFAIVLLICAAGLPPYLVSRQEWKNMLIAADPSYTPMTREKLETEHIVNEAESVMERQLTYLKTQENLTISCDGGTSTGREAFWTTHVSSPKRKVYLMDCREATSESHTAVWIKNFILEACLCAINDILLEFGME